MSFTQTQTQTPIKLSPMTILTTQTNFMKTPWLKNASFDIAFILSPAILSVALVAIFSDSLNNTANTPLWAWLLLVLGIDVSHVYSTLYRTYLNSTEWQENKTLLTVIPIAVWCVGVLLYSVGQQVFWSVLAYVAVFHFIRQQYGFLRLYSRADSQAPWERRLDSAIIYLATLYPILYWHTHQPRNFHWFVDGDFLPGLPPALTIITAALYGVVGLAYIGNEGRRVKHGHRFNVPKNLVVTGTALSWYAGIIYFNGDMIFTITNVVSHGIPYMALVWLYGEKQQHKPQAPLIAGRFSYKLFFSKYSLPIFFASLLLLGYIEEGFWAGFVWREHLEAFGAFAHLPAITAKDTLSWLIPLLTLPQATHYVLDGFIWKLKDSEANWQKVIFNR